MAAQVKLPDIQGKSIYEGRFVDRAPECRAAGKLTSSGDTTEQCLRPKDTRPPSPDVIRKFRATVRPDAGQMRVFYGKAYDPHRQWAVEMTHGVNTQPSSSSKETVNPPPNTLFQQRIIDRKEGCYQSHIRAPLGKSHDQAHGLPKGLDKTQFTFGIPTQLDIGAGGLINPNKNYERVFKEAHEGHEIYVKSHADYYPLERVCRSYTSPNFHPQKCYGLPTPHCNDGKRTKETLTWIHETQGDKAAKIVSKRLDDFREKSQPQLGQVHDPIKDTLRVPPDHTFGILHKPDPYGAGDVIHNRKMDNILRGKESQRAIVAAMRQQLKKLNYHHFDNLLEAFRFYDQEGKGKITLDNLRTVCIKYRLPIDTEILERVLDYCDADRDGMINYLEFANFLNWKEKMPTGLEELGPPPMMIGVDSYTQKFMKDRPPAKLVDEKDLVPKTPQSGEVTPRTVEKQIDFSVGNHSTSNGMYSAVVGPGGISTQQFRTYGVPTIRSDLPAPRVKRVDDRKNYGDEAFAYGLMNPTIYSQHNVHERDLLTPRSLEEIRSIFTNIGVRMTREEMENAYRVASANHPCGFVSVEAFRNVLDEIQMQQIRAGAHPMALGEAL
ncbi:EF-hand domain-containing family member B [Aplysia californica]|uniref:EF-hand domain-containing family member B n=1 Tax=Aplysia californica TaxID=6500 RepID=A0ABM0JRE4_APLCA|nr:EF-hand domain-containing family member B [Aplysia californica]